MKKYLLLLASAALLLVGCAKEKFAEPSDGGLTKATFSVSVDGGVATRALADNDGKGAKVNRCIMEIYFQDQLYKRMEAAMSETPATATFANVPVVAGKEYQILFWADCGGDGQIDKYYTTKTDTNNKGLKAVTVNGTAFKGALETGNNDELDAFYAAQNYTVSQTGGNAFTIKLHRPFAQLNVITTDVAAGKTVINADLLPEKVSVSYTAATTFNVADSTVTGSATYAYEAPVYGEKNNWETVKARGEFTLSMDYILASKEQGLVNVTFKTLNGTTEVMSHSLANLPYQRNYRTNVKGDLLTVGGSWKAEITPAWTGETTHPVVIATTLAEAQAAFGPASGGEAASTVIVKPEAVTNRNTAEDKEKSYVESKTHGITLPVGAKAIEFVLTPQSQKDVTFELPALPADTQTEKFYWYIRHEANYPTKNLNVKVSDNNKTRVIIDAPDETHVELNDVEYEHVIAFTGDNTLVVPQGIKVDKLTVKKGGVEIHGVVTALEVLPAEGKNVYFRSCEGLSPDVFAAIKGEGHDYIDPMYAYEQVGEKYNIHKLPVVAMIGEKEYPSIAAALAAVQANETIEILSDIALDKPITISNSDITIDGNSHIIAVSDAEYWNQYKIGGANQGLGKVNMISVKGSKFTLKDVTLDGKDCRGVSLCTTSGGKDVLYQNVTYTGRGSGHYYGEAAGLVTFDGCKFDTHGYAVHFGGESSVDDDVVIKNCELNGWSSFGACKNVTISDSHFGGANDEGKNGWLAVLRPYCPTTITNCTFSDIYLHEAVTGYECIGLGTGAATTVILNGCKIVNDSKQEITGAEIYSIVRDNGFDNEAAKNGSVFAFDATGNATDGYTAGTFYAINSANIKAAPSYVVSAVEGKDNIWIIDGPYEARIGQVYFTKLQDAVDAVQTGETITLLCNVTNFPNIEDVLLKDFSVDAQGTGFDSFYIKNATTGIRYYDGGKTIRGSLSYPYETLEIPEGVTATIGAKNYENTGLKYVKLPSTMRVLGDGAFCKAHQLEKIYYKDGDEYKEGLAPYLTQIGGAVFQETESFNMSIVIPEGITSVGSKTFYESSVRSVVLPEGLISIGSDGLRGARNMTEITIPASLQTIGSQAFRDCTNLKTINLLFETVPETIGSYTFNAVSAAFGATTPGVIYVKNQAVADALWNVFDSNAKNYYSIKDYDDHSIVYYKGSKIE